MGENQRDEKYFIVLVCDKQSQLICWINVVHGDKNKQKKLKGKIN